MDQNPLGPLNGENEAEFDPQNRRDNQNVLAYQGGCQIF